MGSRIYHQMLYPYHLHLQGKQKYVNYIYGAIQQGKGCSAGGLKGVQRAFGPPAPIHSLCICPTMLNKISQISVWYSITTP